jgi:hypothetical protein
LLLDKQDWLQDKLIYSRTSRKGSMTDKIGCRTRRIVCMTIRIYSRTSI